jgi:(2R)-ethylmalonyl-CoA mutase
VGVGGTRHPETDPSPLLADGAAAIETVDPDTEAQVIEAIRAWRAGRDSAAVDQALRELAAAAKTEANLVEASMACARAGVTTGEWAATLREVFGEYRAPTGLAGASAPGSAGSSADAIGRVRDRVRAVSEELGQRLRILVGKPGLDGHSNGAEQVAVRARDVGFEVIYQGIRLTPAEIVAAAVAEDVHVVGLSVLSGSHLEVVPAVVEGLRAAGAGDVPVVVGGIIPPRDAESLRAQGVARVFTPKDFELTDIMNEIVNLIRPR